MNQNGGIVGMMVAATIEPRSFGDTQFLDFTKPAVLKQLQRLIAQVPNAAVTITSITRLSNGHILLKGSSIPGFVIVIQTSTSLSPETYANLTPSITADAAGLWQYDDADAVGAVNRFYRATLP
jgi:hypothetical protein